MHLNLIELRQQIHSEVFDYNALMHSLKMYKAPHQKINLLLKKNMIIRIKKGLYIFGPALAKETYSKELLANLIYGPSYISMEYALFYYGMIPERVETITSVTFKKNKFFKTPVGSFEYRHINQTFYSRGVNLLNVNSGISILIASPEKALADYIKLSKRKIFFESMNDVKAFLYEDLRVDHEKISKLNIKKLIACSHPRDRGIRIISDYLKKKA